MNEKVAEAKAEQQVQADFLRALRRSGAAGAHRNPETDRKAQRQKAKREAKEWQA